MTERFAPRPPFGMTLRAIQITLAVGALSTIAGFAIHIAPLSVLGLCVLLTALFLLLAWASFRAQAHTYVLDDAAVTVERKGETTVIPYDTIKRISTASVSGGVSTLVIETPERTWTFGAMAHTKDQVARLVRAVEARRSHV